jgi:hypothetical protein
VLAALQVAQNSWSRLQTKTVNAFADGDQVLVEQESTVVGEDGPSGSSPSPLSLSSPMDRWPRSAPIVMTALRLTDRRGVTTRGDAMALPDPTKVAADQEPSKQAAAAASPPMPGPNRAARL